MSEQRLEDQLASVFALGDPSRRELYLYVASQNGEVSRDEAARALGLSRRLAAFHLDKLVKAGLLEVAFRRLSGRRGPGAGRPNKLYRRSGAQLDVSLPRRRYELAARLMARALTESPREGGQRALHALAREWGEHIGAEARARAGAGHDQARLLQCLSEVLREVGFEPRRDEREGIVLRNCPFSALTADSRSLICGMNEALIQGVVAGLAVPGVRAMLDPQPGMCCVAIRRVPGS